MPWMNAPLCDEAYWQEVGTALRSMLGLAVVLAAAGAAALTLPASAADPLRFSGSPSASRPIACQDTP